MVINAPSFTNTLQADDLYNLTEDQRVPMGYTGHNMLAARRARSSTS